MDKQLRFSLIEMLIVIAIFAVLSSILMPAFNKMVSKSDRMVTTNNFNRSYQAFQLFAEDHEDWILANDTLWSSEQGYTFTNRHGRESVVRWPLKYNDVIYFEGYLTLPETKQAFHIVELDKYYEDHPYRREINMGKAVGIGFERSVGARHFFEIEKPEESVLLTEAELQPNGIYYWKDRRDVVNLTSPLQYRNGERYLLYTDGHLESHFYTSIERVNLNPERYQRMYFGLQVW